jgi:hypothetical protein
VIAEVLNVVAKESTDQDLGLQIVEALTSVSAPIPTQYKQSDVDVRFASAANTYCRAGAARALGQRRQSQRIGCGAGVASNLLERTCAGRAVRVSRASTSNNE